jgi:cyclic pyranopterin phosphate synthase
MAQNVIPLKELRGALPIPAARLESPAGLLSDALARPLRDLRISVTDRCNFRCT